MSDIMIVIQPNNKLSKYNALKERALWEIFNCIGRLSVRAKYSWLF